LGFVDDEQRPARCPIDLPGAEPLHRRARGSHPERGIANAQLGDDVIPLAHAVHDTLAKGFLVERDRRASAVDPQLDPRYPNLRQSGFVDPDTLSSPLPR
jgi:hypothetical protein